MSIKKIALLASMALAAMAVVGTASAAAETPKLYDLEHTEVELKGAARFQALGSGIECEVHATLTHGSGEGTPLVASLEITTSTCAGYGKIYKECEVESYTLNEQPWSIDLLQHGLTAANVGIESELENCALAPIVHQGPRE
jgi:hypothetical protein